MGHRRSEFRFRIENEYKSRIRFIKLTEELLDKKLVQYTFRNQIDIRLLMIGKYIILKLKENLKLVDFLKKYELFQFFCFIIN